MASRHRTRHAVVMMAAVMIAGSACSSAAPEKDAPQVATLAGTGATPSAPASAAARPRERLDTTPEEFEAMLKPYNQCLREHGAKPKQDWKRNERPTTRLISKLEAADKICNPLYFPLPPWEKDPANPEAKDFARDVVKCLKGRGIRYVEVGDNGIDIALGGDQNDRESISKGLDLAPECERQVAARRK
ncbi:hypothetical protein COUCH_25800 [Couchioplanes caeruleus]|uniref:hypothetical protein n=1 Tax=Couchioplanes caeruleus TaxID=56438 RepID=UPI0020BFB60A|nr:hypothetical protein [Couchioplanes caeruleus]UQU62436.1 hypothetical protein COUCH_25800 [Couchioplanes caeruleus]